MAGISVVYDEAKFTWRYTAGDVPAAELRLKLGTQSGVYQTLKTFGPTTTGADLDTVLPAGSTGQFYAKLVTANAKGEGVASTELPFVVSDGLPNGSLDFSIG